MGGKARFFQIVLCYLLIYPNESALCRNWHLHDMMQVSSPDSIDQREGEGNEEHFFFIILHEATTAAQLQLCCVNVWKAEAATTFWEQVQLQHLKSSASYKQTHIVQSKLDLPKAEEDIVEHTHISGGLPS